MKLLSNLILMTACLIMVVLCLVFLKITGFFS